MSETIEVVARMWKGGWELSIAGEPVTQVRTLEHARQQVVDYLDTVAPEIDHAGADVRITADVGGDLGDRIHASRAATLEAHERQVEAARQTRQVVRELRASKVSVADAAALLGVSRGRISQIAKGSA